MNALSATPNCSSIALSVVSSRLARPLVASAASRIAAVFRDAGAECVARSVAIASGRP
jgi:hypothetical protein